MLKRIVVHVDHDADCEQRVRTAAGLATYHHAELIGVYASFLQPRYPYDGAFLSADIWNLLERHLSEETDKVRRSFVQTAQAEGVKPEWRTGQDLPETALATHARYGDVLVMSQPDHGAPGPVRMPNVVGSVILGAGRPVLLLPYAGTPKPIGNRILFCWNRSREAARALADAAPFLESADELVVLSIDPADGDAPDREAERQDFVAYCKSHSYPDPKFITGEGTEIGVGNSILNVAADQAIDLIVMGAYGHSQLRESILGGASRTMIESMTVPVLFSH